MAEHITRQDITALWLACARARMRRGDTKRAYQAARNATITQHAEELERVDKGQMPSLLTTHRCAECVDCCG